MSYKELPLEKKIAQMIILGFGGASLKKHASIKKDIEETGIGGLIFFDKDMIGNSPVNNIQSPHQLKELIQEAQSKSAIPLWMSIDQEGGKIARLRKESGFMEFPSAAFLGEMNDLAYTELISKKHAELLSWLGINLNFAPCVDVNLNPSNPIIAGKERSFSADPTIVTKHVTCFSKTMLSNGIMSCAKHFPGHGSSAEDSHQGLTDITDTWQTAELQPYKHMIEENCCPMVMIGHLMLRHIDPKLPASLSKKILDSLLKEKLGFNGIITTDDLQMRAISDHYSLKETLVMAIQAGSDLVVFGNNLLPEYVGADRIIAIILEAIDEGSLSEARIQQSYDKLIAAKQKLNLS